MGDDGRSAPEPDGPRPWSTPGGEPPAAPPSWPVPEPPAPAPGLTKSPAPPARPWSSPTGQPDWRAGSPWAPPAYTPAPPESVEPAATVALTAALLSFLAPIVPAVVALFTARHAAGRIRAAGGRLGGAGRVTAARALAGVSLGLWSLLIVLVAVGAVVGDSGGNTSSSAAAGTGEPTAAPSPAPTRTTPATRAPDADAPELAIGNLNTGDCIRDLVDGAVTAVRIVSCDSLHGGEVFGIGVITDGTYAQKAQAADRLCRPLFAAYVGVPVDASTLGLRFITPSEAGWAAGDRDVVCLLQGAGGALLDRSMAGARGSGEPTPAAPAPSGPVRVAAGPFTARSGGLA